MKNNLLFLCLILFLFSCKKENNTNPETLPNAYSNQETGQSGNDILSANTYTTLNIQVQYMAGYQLDSIAIANVTGYLNNICNKPGGISITQSQIAATGDTMNLGQVAILEARDRIAYTVGKTVALYIMVTDGYDTTGNILGIAYRNTSIVMFGKDIFDHSGGAGEVTRVALESGVLEHELGHLMGLVNLGTPMQFFHQDTAHGYHCTNPNCLMYWEIETHEGFGSVVNNIPTLDSNCLNDLRANGGK